MSLGKYKIVVLATNHQTTVYRKNVMRNTEMSHTVNIGIVKMRDNQVQGWWSLSFEFLNCLTVWNKQERHLYLLYWIFWVMKKCKKNIWATCNLVNNIDTQKWGLWFLWLSINVWMSWCLLLYIFNNIRYIHIRFKHWMVVCFFI